MKIIIDMIHPFDVHFFKNFIYLMKEKNHNILITSRQKEMTNYLLDAFKIDHTSISSIGDNFFSLGKELVSRSLKFLKIAKRFKPDVLIGFNGPTIAPVGKLLNIPSIVFYDTEHASITNTWVYPLANRIITPKSYKNYLGKKHVTFQGYCELAYLHPNYYKPDLEILNQLEIDEKEKYALIRFVSWKAVHDVGKERMSISQKRRLVELISKKFRVFISSEGKLPLDLQKYKINIPFEKIHDALYFADIYVGDGASMTSEAALLGVPSIYTSSLSLGYLGDLEKKYGLIYNIRDSVKAIEKIIFLIEKSDVNKKIWKNKRAKLLEENIDVTRFMVDYIEKFCSAV